MNTIKAFVSLFIIVSPFISNGQDTLYITKDESYPNHSVIRFVQNNVESNIPNSYRLNDYTFLLKCRNGGSFDRHPWPKYTFILGKDTMRIEIIFDRGLYKLFIDNLMFQSGNYKLFVEHEIESCGSDPKRKYYIKRSLVTVKGCDFYDNRRIIMIEDVQWDEMKNEPSPELILKFRHSMRTLPINEVRFYYVNLCPQAVLTDMDSDK